MSDQPRPRPTPAARVFQRYIKQVEDPRPAITVAPSALTYQVGGRSYPLRSGPKCVVCQSKFRQEIETALVKGYAYTSIVRSCPPGSGITTQGISQHVKSGHLPIPEHIRRQIVEDRAKELGRSLEFFEGPLVDHVSFARQVIQQVFEDIAEGKQTPTISEAIQLANMLVRVEEWAGESFDASAMQQAFVVFMEAARQIMTHDQLRRFGTILDRNPVLKAISAQSTRVVEGQEAS